MWTKENDVLKEIKNKNQTNEDLYNKLRPVGCQSWVFYGLANVRKKLFDVWIGFRPIRSAIGTLTDTIAKFLLFPKLKDLI